jgi:2-keto-4-pentenoate hydratase
MSEATRVALDEAAVDAAVARLQDAAAARMPCAPIRDLAGRNDFGFAYEVQRRMAAARCAAGARVVGHKIGLTAAAVQAQIGVDRPDFGLLFDDMDVSGGPVDVTRLLQPKIEAEVAFVLAEDLIDPTVTVTGVRRAVAAALPALEIVDSRIAGWDIAFVDTVADNASSGLFVLGEARVPLTGFEPRTARMTMLRNGEVVSEGNGAASLGDPLNALVWLARTAIEMGNPLRAGHLVLSGALGPMVDVRPGDRFRTEITGLGEAEAVFSA